MTDAPAVPLDDRAFRKLAELSPEALFVHGGGKVLWANEAAARLTGYPSAESMRGVPVANFLSVEARRLVAERGRVMSETGQSVPPLEETFLDVHGQPLPVEVAASPLGDGVFVVSARDLRPKRQAESRTRAFFAATTAAMGISRLGVHVEVNAAYARLFGYESPEQLVGVPILELIDPAEHQTITERVARRARGEPVPTQYPTKARRRDGSPLFLDVHASSILEEGAQTTVVVVRDITTQRQFEERLAASEARLRELLQTVPVGVWEEDLSRLKVMLEQAGERAHLPVALRERPELLLSLTRELRVLSANATACRMAGARDQAELIANLPRVFVSDTLPELGNLLLQLLEGRAVATTECWLGTLDGQRRWVAVTATAAEPDWRRVLVTTSDMTEQHRARQEREALVGQLRHAEKLEAIGRLAGGVAHDFNNLLAAVMSATDASLHDAPDGPLRENLELIREASLRARDLVQQILTFGRKTQPNVAPLEISEVVTSSLALARAAIPSNITLELAVAPAVGTVLADRTQLNQVLLNLCTNARDAVGPHGRIRVSLSRHDERARLCVEDDGPGIDESMRARLFEPYVTTKEKGIGLGLAVVHGIVTAAGGTIEIDSAPGRGARFVIELPLVAHAPTPTPAPPPHAAASAQRHVLIVDDHPMVRSALRRLLRSLGFRSSEAEDGQAALERLRAGPDDVDLVLSDQTMPRLSGLELAKTLLAERPGTRFLLCTGFSDVLDRASALELGVKDVLAKPIDRDALLAALERALA
ncbi:MAG: PAS domain-containing hybrid sensor histidine kinase/response regulator [Myxococcota bacterium]